MSRSRGKDEGVAGADADGARQLHRAVFVGILQAGVDENGRRGAFEPLLEIFLGDAGHRHDAVL